VHGAAFLTGQTLATISAGVCCLGLLDAGKTLNLKNEHMTEENRDRFYVLLHFKIFFDFILKKTKTK